MPSPDPLVPGKPVMVEAHPFDFLVAAVRDLRRTRDKINEELQIAAAELRQAEQKLQEFIEQARK